MASSESIENDRAGESAGRPGPKPDSSAADHKPAAPDNSLPPLDAEPTAAAAQGPHAPHHGAPAGGGQAEATERSKLADPPRRPGRLIVWLMLVICLAVACPALFVDLHRPAVVSPDEARTLATSIQTWRPHPASNTVDPPNAARRLGVASLVPDLNGEPQLQRPPAGTWSHVLIFHAWHFLSNWLYPLQEATPDHLVTCARIASVLFALLTIAAVYWAGHSIGGLKTAVLAALVCAANPVLVYHARLATAGMQHAALNMVAIAAALWAIRPLRPAPSVERQFLGWVGSGLALGGAILTAGPWTMLYIVCPILFILVLCPGRLSHLMGLLASTLIGTLLVVPWLVYADEQDPQAYRQWLQSMAPMDWTDWGQLARQAGERVGMLLLALLPWTIWIAGSVVQPFSTSSAGSRSRMLMGWVWFACSLVLVVLNPDRVRLDDQLVILPAGAILIGQLFHQYTELAAEGRYARFWRLLRWPHLGVLIVASGTVPALMYLKRAPISREWISDRLVHQWYFGLGIDDRLVQLDQWYFGLGLAIVLLGILFLSLRWSINQFPTRALVCWALWTQVLVAVVAIPVSRGPMLTRTRFEADILAGLDRNQPMYWLQLGDHAVEPDPALLLYADRRVFLSQVEDLTAKQDPFLLVTKKMATASPLERFGELKELPSLKLSLWQYDVPAQPTNPQ